MQNIDFVCDQHPDDRNITRNKQLLMGWWMHYAVLISLMDGTLILSVNVLGFSQGFHRAPLQTSIYADINRFATNRLLSLSFIK